MNQTPSRRRQAVRILAPISLLLALAPMGPASAATQGSAVQMSSSVVPAAVGSSAGYGGLTRNAAAVKRASQRAWPQVSTYYGYRGGSGSDHNSGKALDVMVPNYRSSSGRALGGKIARWAVANHSRLHIKYVIWNQHIWNVSRAGEGWRPMGNRGSDSANHKNHVHISVR